VWPGIVVSEENLKVRMLRRTGVNAWREQSCGLPPPFPPPQVGEGWVGGHGTVGNRSGAVSVRASASIPAI
jgi:hypothetical protein